MRILLDSNLLVRVGISPFGAASAIVRLIQTAPEHVLLSSEHLRNEVADVLGRSRIRERFAITDRSVKQFLERLANTSENVAPDPLPAVIVDPEDQAVIEAAVSGRADVLCTLDRHFHTPEVLSNSAPDTAFR
jgi:putative PIN family toxin of toxin-antitoxin system